MYDCTLMGMNENNDELIRSMLVAGESMGMRYRYIERLRRSDEGKSVEVRGRYKSKGRDGGPETKVRSGRPCIVPRVCMSTMIQFVRREAVCMVKLTGRREWSSWSLFLACGCGEERLVGDCRFV